jgi:hypothetical protein
VKSCRPKQSSEETGRVKTRRPKQSSEETGRVKTRRPKQSSEETGPGEIQSPQTIFKEEIGRVPQVSILRPGILLVESGSRPIM